MPWVPELFSAPVIARLEAERGRRVEDVPYFAGLTAGDADALVGSFVGEPRLQHPLRGLVEGEYEFREFVADTERWLRERDARVEDVHRAVLERHGFEEVVLHLGGARGPIDLAHAMVADHAPDGRIEEIRVYFSTRALTGRATERAPLLGGDPELRLPAPVGVHLAEERERGVNLEPCALVEDGEACALEYNAHRPGTDAPIQAGLTVFEQDADGALAAARSYDDVDRRVEER
jgi:hypothetical protein